jgi:hypothetical protein
MINSHFAESRERTMTENGPLFVSSGDLVADRRCKWVRDHAAQGDFAGAAFQLGLLFVAARASRI